MGDWKVLLPEAGTNYVLNPTGMASTNVTAVGAGTPTQVTTYSYLGYKCHRLVTAGDNQGAYYTLSALANAIHYVTLRINTASDLATFDISLDNAEFYDMALVKTEGSWYVYGLQVSAAKSSGSTKLYIQQKGDAGGDPLNLFIGHIQVEQNTYATTPITGDLKGFTTNGYYWNGTPNASSSTRTAQERSGGKEVDLDTTYSFKVKYGLGSGMPPVTHHTQGMALLPGALYQGSKVEPRVLDLVSVTKASTASTVSAARKNFINAVKSDRVTPEQPVVFVYYGANSTKPIKFNAYYDSGMEFQLNSGVTDQPTARFICYDPFGYEFGTGSAALTTSSSVADADYVIRKVSGTWYNVSTDYDGTVYALATGADGSVYIAGSFTQAAPNPDIDYISKWNPYSSALSALTGGTGSGTNGSVYALAAAPNGDIYLGGSFTLAGGIANTVRVAYWDVSASEFVAMSTGIDNGTVYCLCADQSGNIYIGGNFTNAGGDDEADYIAIWGGTTIDELLNGTAGADAPIHDMAITPNGDLYVVGEFANIGGVAAAGVAKWNGAAWSALGAGLTGSDAHGYSIAIDAAGNIYVGGDFTAADGVSCLNIAKWNGKTFEPLGSGLGTGTCRTLFFYESLLYAGGDFDTAGGLTLADTMAIWNGTTWVHIDANIGGMTNIYAIMKNTNGLYIGGAFTGTTTAAYLNTVTNNGSTAAYPVIKIYRAEDGTSAVLEFIKNETTGDTLWCNYSLLKGETLTIDFTPGNRSIKSNFFGDVWRAILRPSDLSSFRLLPGANSISVFVNPTDAPTITAWAEWPTTHWAADTVAA